MWNWFERLRRLIRAMREGPVCPICIAPLDVLDLKSEGHPLESIAGAYVECKCNDNGCYAINISIDGWWPSEARSEEIKVELDGTKMTITNPDPNEDHDP